MNFNSLTISSSRSPRRAAIATVAFVVLGALFRFASPASAGAIVDCKTLTTVTTDGSCILAAGESVQVTLKAGNGGAGGNGGDGGNGGLGLDGSGSQILGGTGGLGGVAGMPGAGAKITGVYTNTTNADVTLSWTIGASGAFGVAGFPGMNGIDAIFNSTSGTAGGFGAPGSNGADGAPATLSDGASFSLTAGGGTGSLGAGGGTGGTGGNGNGTVGTNGTNGAVTLAGVSGEGTSTSPLPDGFSFVSTNSFEAVGITFAEPTVVPLATTGSSPSHLAGIATVFILMGAALLISGTRISLNKRNN
jgi:hypothetical protein